MLNAPIGEIVSRSTLTADVSAQDHRSRSQREAAGGLSLGPVERALVDATRQGLRQEEGFLRTLLRSELQRQSCDPQSVTVLTTKQAAALCGVSPKTIRAWTKSGRLKALGAAPFKFEKAAVEAARDRKPHEENVLDYGERAEQLLNRTRGR
ncbi:MAG: helix-turn-helix domain-containing protein [Nannocystales bacterium]